MRDPQELSATVEQIVAGVRQSRRYRDLDESVVRRCASQAALAHRRPADALKRTKRHLHQIYGAYLGTAPKYARLSERLRAARAEGREALERELRKIMSLHASTRERVANVDRFYGALFERVGEVRSAIDLGCGLNPLAVPWMRLAPDAVYTAVDIDPSLVAFVGDCLDMLGVQARPLVGDVVAPPPFEPAELGFVLKMLPCLEQQVAGAGAAAIRTLPVRTVAVSFPTRSLGGRGKGMEANYGRQFHELAERERWDVEQVAVPGELLFLIRK